MLPKLIRAAIKAVIKAGVDAAEANFGCMLIVVLLGYCRCICCRSSGHLGRQLVEFGRGFAPLEAFQTQFRLQSYRSRPCLSMRWLSVQRRAIGGEGPGTATT